MKPPFKGWLWRVMEFLKSPEGGVICIWFQTARFLQHIASHPPNPPRAETYPALTRWVYGNNERWAALEAWDGRLQWGFAGGTPAPLLP